MFRMFIYYLFYRITAPHRKGYGIHSPFVYHLVTEVLLKGDDENLTEIRKWRDRLKKSREWIRTDNRGAGSRIHKNKIRQVRQIIKHSSITHKYGRLLYHVTRESNPSTIIELGTGLGISTAYLVKACPGKMIITVDADKQKLDFAKDALKKLKITQPEFFHGSFDELLLSKLKYVNHPLLVFIDGDHRYESVMGIFELILKYAREDTVIILDDISWSREMRQVWKMIKGSGRTILCIDLFFTGLVFFRKGMVKQNYVIKI